MTKDKDQAIQRRYDMVDQKLATVRELQIEIPDRLLEACVSFLELCLDEILISFGPDLSEDEIQVAELLRDFTSKHKEK